MTTAELLALAVLRGDEGALAPLLDELLAQRREGLAALPPVRKVTCGRDRLRVALFMREDSDTWPAEVGQLNTDVNAWLDGTAGPLYLAGVERIELYELP